MSPYTVRKRPEQLIGRTASPWQIRGRVRPHPLLSLLGALVLGTLALAPVNTLAQQHRATRLGDPSGRFADPLKTPEDLRALFRNESLKADVVAILDQAGWKGDPADLRRAAATAEIRPLMIPNGTRLPFMSSRKNKKPVALMDVLWAGKQPIDAYEFLFSSRGHRYRCITPKACANFLVEDLGPEAGVTLTKTAPGKVSRCDPIDVVITVRNTGGMALHQVQITDVMPEGLKTAVDNLTSLNLDAGTLQPGEGKEFRFRAVASTAGKFTNPAKVTTAEGAMAEAKATTEVQAPVLTLDCQVPSEVLPGRPVEVCLTARNTGDAAEPVATLGLPIPAGATVASLSSGGRAESGQVIWDLANLAPGDARKVCATFNTSRDPMGLVWNANLQGTCAPTVQTQCATKITGITAILLEVVDLEDPVELGQPVTYEIRVTNQGSAPGTNIRLVCAIPESQEFVSGSGPTTVKSEGRTVTIEPLATLEPKAVATWRVVVKALTAADARFKADLTSDQFQRPVEEYEATSQY